jgi:small-conductance mechanosensitive channel
MQELFDRAIESMRQVVQRLVPEGDWANLVLGLIASLLVTIFFVILHLILRRLFARNQRWVRSWTRIRPLRCQNQDILSAGDITNILAGSLKGLYYVVLLFLFSAYMNAIFSFFPWTQDWAAALFGYVLTAITSVIEAIVGYLPKLIFVIIIFFLTLYLIKFARLIFNGIAQGRITLSGFYPEWASPTFNILRLLVIAFALVIVFPYLPGSESQAFQGVSIFLGILFSLGSTAAVANVVAGVVITYTRAFQKGDRVKIADTIGDVVEKTLFVTRVKTVKNVEIAIPNSMVLANHIINFSSLSEQPGLILHTTVTIGYDIPWRDVERLLIEAAQSTDRIQPSPAPFVHQTSLDDFYVSYELNAYTEHAHEMSALYSDLHRNIQDRFHEAGIEITSPHFSAIRDGNQTTIPNDYLPKDYSPPAFRIHPLERLFLRESKSSSKG